MTTVAFIGLGIMGAPMARNLVSAGFEVVGFNRTREKTRPLVEAGGRSADSVAEAVAGADVVATMLPDTPDVEAVLAEVFAHAAPNALVVDFSTIRPDASAALAEEGRRRGLRMLDAPVSGGEQAAIDGTLSVMVGGDGSDFEAAGELFSAVGATIVHVGPSGAGQTVKAANQLIVAGNIELLAEAIVFLEAYEVALGPALTVLGGGLAGSTVLERKARPMTERSFAPGFRIALHHKDLGIVGDAARQKGVVLPLGAVVSQLVASLNARQDGGLDHSALVKLVAELSGR